VRAAGIGGGTGVRYPDLPEDDQDQFVSFYRAEYPRTYRLALSVGMHPAGAKEITDEAFTRALERWDRIARFGRAGRVGPAGDDQSGETFLATTTS